MLRVFVLRLVLLAATWSTLALSGIAQAPQSPTDDEVRQQIDRLGNKSRSIRQNAMEVLGGFGPASAAAVPELARLLASDGDDGYYAAMALGEIGPRSAASVPAMVKLLRSLEKKDVRFYVPIAAAVLKIDPSNVEAKKAIRTRLPEVFEWIDFSGGTDLALCAQLSWIMEIGPMGPHAAVAVPTLKKLRGAEPEETRIYACGALLLVAPDSAENADAAARHLSKYVEILKDKECQGRLFSVRVLGQLGPRAASAVPTLRQFRDDPDPVIRRAVIAALDKIVP